MSDERRYLGLLSIILILLLTFGAATPIYAQGTNVGLLRVTSIRGPRQVAPSSKFSMAIDVEYAVHTNGTIKLSLFEGSLKNIGQKLWESEPSVVTGGGDRLWVINLTAPSAEQGWVLTVIASYLETGEWSYYDTPFNGPGYAEFILKVNSQAELIVDLGTPKIPVAINASTNQTSTTGQVRLQLPVGKSYHITIPPVVQFDDSTRIVFVGWQGDGSSATQRTLMLDGDSKIVGSYKRQYLLQVNSNAPGYSNSTWYDAGSRATLAAKPTVTMSWPFGLLGLSYTFKGWSGAANSASTQLNITMNGPKVVTADFTVDYTPLVMPAIILVGVLGALALFIAKRRIPTRSVSSEETDKEEPAKEAPSKVCASCGKPVETDWKHCVHCGKALNATEPI
jgi:hypothetical protein